MMLARAKMCVFGIFIVILQPLSRTAQGLHVVLINFIYEDCCKLYE